LKLYKPFSILAFSVLVLTNHFLTTNCATPPELKSSTAKDSDDSQPTEVRAKIKSAKKVLNEGNELFQKEKIEEAKKASENSIEIYPTAEGYYLLGSCEFKLGRHAKAREAFEKAMVISPKLEQLLLTYALTLTTLGEEEKAIEVYKNLEEYYPKEKVYPFKLGVLLKSLKRYEESFVALKRAEDPSFKQKLQLYMQIGDVALQLKKYEEAEEYFAKAKELDSNYKTASDSSSATKVAKLLEKGNQAIREKDYQKAAGLFREAASISPKSPAPLVFLGNAYILLKRDREAEETFRKVLQIDSKSLEGYSALGTLYNKTGKNSEAIKILKRGLELYPSDASLQNKIGLSYKNLGDTKKALLSFSKSIELDPKFSQARMNLGFLFLDEKRFSEAKREFSEAKKLPDGGKAKDALTLTEISLLIDKGDKLLVKGKVDEALKEYSKAKAIKQSEPVISNAYGRAYFVSKKYGESENSFKASLAIDKNNIPAMQGLIRLYSAQNKRDAKIYTEKLESLTKGNPLAGIAVGRTHEDKKEFSKAEEIYKDLLVKYPENESVNYRLGALYYKIALEKNSKEEFQSAISYLEKAQKYKTGIPEIEETEKVIKSNLKFGEILPLVKKGNKLFDSRKYREAIEPFTSAYKKTGRPSLLIKIAECHIALGEEEKGIRILRDSIENEKDGKIEIREAINAYFLKKGQLEKAEEGFKEILRIRPESYYSLYQLGLIYLGKKDYTESFRNLERSISLNPNFAAAHIARGIIYYKQNDKGKAKEEFEEAMKKDSTLELAPYNIGILYFNDDLLKEAEKVFLSLTEKYPDFPDSFYHLSYLHFKKNDFSNAEKYIKSALKIERSPSSLYAYIRILEAMYSGNALQETAELQSELNRELVEKFPDSEYAKLAESRLVKTSTDSVIVQKYPLTDRPVTPPIFVNGKMIINYGSSVVALDSRTKSVVWRKEMKDPYLFMAASTRIFAASKDSLEEIDIQTGTVIKKISLAGNTPTSLKVKSKAFLSTINTQGKMQISAYGPEGDNVPVLNIKKETIWTLFENGKIFFAYEKKNQLEWSIYSPDFVKISKGETITKDGSTKIVSVRSNKIGILKGDKFFDLDDTGKVTQYPKMEGNIRSIFSEGDELFFIGDKKITKVSADGSLSDFQNSNIKDFSAMKLKEGKSVMVTKDGELSIMKLTGEILKTKSTKDSKSQSAPIEIYSILYRE